MERFRTFPNLIWLIHFSKITPDVTIFLRWISNANKAKATKYDLWQSFLPIFSKYLFIYGFVFGSTNANISYLFPNFGNIPSRYFNFLVVLVLFLLWLLFEVIRFVLHCVVRFYIWLKSFLFMYHIKMQWHPFVNVFLLAII